MMIKVLNRLLFPAFVFLFASCERDPMLIDINNLNGNEVGVFGHGGMGIKSLYPIDSWPSLEKCLELGADGTEIDIQITKDSVAVAYHHQKLEDGTNCYGVVSEKLWQEIDGCDHSSVYNNVRVERLADIFDKIGHLQEHVFTFDCKLYSSEPDRQAYLSRYANALIKLIDDHDISSNVFIESQDSSFLRMIRQRRPGLKLFIYPSSFESGLAIAEAMDLYGITTHYKDITKAQVELAHLKGIYITLWGMQSRKENLQALEKSPDYTQSDEMVHLLKMFGKYK
jgi:glycerophosphoryl diester phosphodiesterase